MKYISTVIAVILMAWTWSLATTERPFKLEQHKKVEAGVEQDIRAFIRRKFPNTPNLETAAAEGDTASTADPVEIYCNRLYTEIVTPETELIAHFRCSSSGAIGQNEAVEQVFEGFIQLRSDDKFETWREVGGNIRAPEVRFQNGIRISLKEPLSDEAEESESQSEGTTQEKNEAAPDTSPITADSKEHKGHQ
jgi:hypothetical protein